MTKWRGTVRRGEQVPAMVGQAFQAIKTGRPRPAALFLPQDLMREPCPVAAERIGFAPTDQPAEPVEGIAEAAALLLRPGGRSSWPAAVPSGRRPAIR